MKRVSLKIFGMVQGVGYRYVSQKEAKKEDLLAMFVILKMAGWK